MANRLEFRLRDYSVRSAWIGSTREAREAGNLTAIQAAEVSKTCACRKVRFGHGGMLIPKSGLESNLRHS
jgi:hypothetical protein